MIPLKTRRTITVQLERSTPLFHDNLRFSTVPLKQDRQNNLSVRPTDVLEKYRHGA